jgi:hypothetical protein
LHSKGWWAAVVAWTLVFLAAFSAWFVFRPGLL